mmetsp:Transcript_1757/g.3542  ORF Transcript_1757/g.3542 Transcript_1757/m.3542 type:complete len:95 (+) Transcript_1757:62-346(+)
MGLFTSSRKKKSSEDLYAAVPAQPATAPAVEVNTASGVVKIPELDLDKAAAVIEARQRGKMARRKTEGLKAFRIMEDDEGFLAKCLPCLRQKES